MMYRALKYLLKVPRYKFIVLSITVALSWTILASFIGNLLGASIIHKTSFLLEKSLFHKFNIQVFLAPIIETLIFQFLIIEFFYFLFKKYSICLIISSLFFGIMHYTNNHNITYTLAAIFAGLIFATIYIISKNRKDLNAFLVVILVHSSTNLFSFLINNIISN